MMARASPGLRAMAAGFKRARAPLRAGHCRHRPRPPAGRRANWDAPPAPSRTASVPTSASGPERCRGCSQGVRPATWPAWRPGPVKRTGKACPTRERLNASCWSRAAPGAPATALSFSASAHLMWRAGGRCSRAGRVFEAIGLGEADLGGPAPWSARTRPSVSPGMPGDEVGRQRQVRPGLAQPVDDTEEVVRGVACGSSPPAPGRCRSAPAGAARASVGAGRDGRRSGRRRHRAGGWWCSAAVAGRGSRPVRAAAGRGPRSGRPGPPRDRR